ncbi:hypothetical protein [Vibrio fluvialis]|uniref:hypothetical protein n=1 Tax=Vibrio fluvialis TaxID=676 RepID=UPI002985385B|nr:hypothetical protein [Vibrio fluvialis]EKO3444946.1 hypothetical protein [Vibrio fluvialis]EKO3994699.1 hypothetical protein [Vibrio fluvialis]MDZ5513917.1 hypothetical protein [Vibrio fluvialis]
MGRSKKNPIVILRGHKTSVFPSDIEARPYYQRVKGVPAIFYKCGTIEKGMRDLIAFQKWEAIAPEFKQRNVSRKEAEAIIQAMLADEDKFVAEQLAEVQRERAEKLAEEARIKSQPTMEERSIAASKKATEQAWNRLQDELEHNKKHVTLKCVLGTGGQASRVEKVSGGISIVEHEKGAKVSLKRMSLGYAALKQADKALSGDAETVKILGLDVTVVNTLREWAPNWKQQNWVKPNGQPRPNAELVRDMLALYEQIKSKISFGESVAQKAPVDDDAPF